MRGVSMWELTWRQESVLLGALPPQKKFRIRPSLFRLLLGLDKSVEFGVEGLQLGCEDYALFGKMIDFLTRFLGPEAGREVAGRLLGDPLR